MSKKIKKIMCNLLTFVMVLAMAIPSTTTKAATTGIVKGSNEVDVENSFSTVLTTGEKASISIKNSVLTIKVDGSESIFKTGNITKTTDAAVITESDGLVHILTLSGVYYVYDLYTGVQLVAYRNSVNGRYCSSRNSHAYMVYGKSFINNMYFYEWITSNSVSRERLMTRIEFDIIIGGGDPSEDEDPTTKPTEAPTQKPTERPTEAPTQRPTEAPTQEPTQSPTERPTERPTEAPTQRPTQAPTEKPTEAPTQKPTQAPTERPTEVPTQVPTERPTETPTEKPTTKKASLKVNKTTVILTSGKSCQISYSAKDKNKKAIKAELTGGAGCFSAKITSTTRIKITAKSVSKTTYGTFTVNNGSLRTIVTVIVNPKKTVDKSTLIVDKDIVVVTPGSSCTVNYKATNKAGKRVRASKVYSGSNHISVAYNNKNIKIKAAKSVKDSIFTTITVKAVSYTKKIFVVTKPVEHVTTKNGEKIIKVNRYNIYNEFQARIIYNKNTKVATFNGITMKNVMQVGFIKNSHNVAILTEDGNLYSLPKKTGNIVLLATNVKQIRSNKYGFVTSAIYNTDQSISIVGQ